ATASSPSRPRRRDMAARTVVPRTPWTGRWGAPKSSALRTNRRPHAGVGLLDRPPFAGRIGGKTDPELAHRLVRSNLDIERASEGQRPQHVDGKSNTRSPSLKAKA